MLTHGSRVMIGYHNRQTENTPLYIQWKHENFWKVRQLLDPRYDFKWSDKHYTQKLSSVNRPISII